MPMQADQLQGMDVDATGPTFVPTGRVYAERGTGAKPKARERHEPYRRPAPAPVGEGGAWLHDRADHDLFSTDSNGYTPRVSNKYDFSARREPPRPSPSLQPFGASFAAASAAPIPVPVNDKPLGSRIKGVAAARSGTAPVSVGGPIRPDAPAFTPREDRAKKEAELKAKREADSKARKQYQDALKVWENGPTELRVSNLADGTSDDDVQTAFADFGPITACKTSPGPPAQGQPTLTANITFRKLADAKAAQVALDGALADGLQLKVTVVGGVGPKPRLNDFLAEIRQAQSSPTAAAVLEARATPAVSGKMQSDMFVDPRSVVQSEPQLQRSYRDTIIRDAVRPPKTLASRLGSGGIASGAPTRPGASQSSTFADPSGLAARLAPQNTTGRSRQGGAAPGLLGRLGRQ